ncbi:hypothetical protein C349_03540 [Cryptococcus neoformans var. grubii Br795]|nr:hypothetical protein C353_03513 [Cryptococcus neoformans var. grubii AD1-83a]OXC84394.1 hypothetical protein C344_03367 [Cryptococcus neoformans var. grubii AD1-7a]OXG58983.1 hypothetical protein C354_03450 [Cryptococcus neoformans var. grubii MW-RSA1955]OXG63560.1 hypothetical protein C351_03238 [Cryptococcus neoformans var. grubii c8]OXG63769.1 hypothetical protein C352_03461 [Cryptococcus neoformans var. grubii CHC193]OXG80899.1 hypothetical protein C350_03390 [Cryptococcus neoformans va
MEDLTSISRSLREILNSSTHEQGHLTEIVQKYLESDDTGTKRAVCEVILELLEEGDEETQTQRRTLLLEDSALTYVSLIIPLSSTAPRTVHSLIQLISMYGRPREVLMALSEALQYVTDRAEGFSVSDDEGDNLPLDDDDVDYESLWAEWQMIISGLIIAIPRLPNARSTPTLLSLSEEISQSIKSLGPHASTFWSRTCLVMLCSLTDTIWDWTQKTTDKGGEQASLLSGILFEALVLLGDKVDAYLTERWFLQTFPKYGQGPHVSKLPQDNEEKWLGGALVYKRALDIAKKLCLTPPLFDRIIYSSNRSTHGTFAAFNILAATIPLCTVDPHLPDPLPQSLLEDMMPVLCAALSGTSIDAGAVWLWWIANRALESKKEGAQIVNVGYDEVTVLIELLVPLTAQYPSPVMRLALFKLIGSLISLLPSKDKILTLRHLLEPENPFDTVRIESMSILREESASNNDLLSPDLLAQLAPILFSPATLSDPDSPFNLSPSDLLSSPNPSWWTEVAQYIWFLSTRDSANKSGVRSTYREDINMWLDAVRLKLNETLNYIQEENGNVKEVAEVLPDHGVEFFLNRWEDALDRARAVLDA